MYRVLGYWTVYCTQSGGVHIFQNTKVTCILLYNLGGCLYFPLKHKSAMYTFVQQRGGGGWDPNHKSMYKCAYMYVHLSLSPPPPPPPAWANVNVLRFFSMLYHELLFVSYVGSLFSYYWYQLHSQFISTWYLRRAIRFHYKYRGQWSSSQWRNDRPCYPCHAGGRHLRGAAYYQTYSFLNEKSFDKVAKCTISRPT